MTEPTLHDIAKGTSGAGDDDDIDGTAYLDSYIDDRTDQERATDEWFANTTDSLTAVADAFTIEREHTFVPRPGHDTCDVCDWGEYTHPTPHVHDEGCNGTLEHAGEILCGYPGSTGHIYCG